MRKKFVKASCVSCGWPLRCLEEEASYIRCDTCEDCPGLEKLIQYKHFPEERGVFSVAQVVRYSMREIVEALGRIEAALGTPRAAKKVAKRGKK